MDFTPTGSDRPSSVDQYHEEDVRARGSTVVKRSPVPVMRFDDCLVEDVTDEDEMMPTQAKNGGHKTQQHQSLLPDVVQSTRTRISHCVAVDKQVRWAPSIQDQPNCNLYNDIPRDIRNQIQANVRRYLSATENERAYMPRGYAYARTASYLDREYQMLCPVPILSRRPRQTWTKDAYDEDLFEFHEAKLAKSPKFSRPVMVQKSSYTRVELIKPKYNDDYVEYSDSDEELKMSRLGNEPPANSTRCMPRPKNVHRFDMNRNLGSKSVKQWYNQVKSMTPNRDQLLTPLKATVRGSRRVVQTIVQDVSRVRDQVVQVGTPLAMRINQVREDPKSLKMWILVMLVIILLCLLVNCSLNECPCKT